MKINERTKVLGDKVVLIPYERLHVAKYHAWMEDGDLRRSCASDRLSLEEEFEMQQRWRDDEDKCTFIVLSVDTLRQAESVSEQSAEIAAMIGDVNLFLTRDSASADATGEISLMIAEPKCRRKGFGTEAASLMLIYGAEVLGVQRFEAKIIADNDASARLFHSLGFNCFQNCPVFNERHFRWSVNQSSLDAWKTTYGYRIDKYNSVREMLSL